MNTPDYQLLCAQVASLAEGEPYWLSVLSNTSALIQEAMDNLNWVGFYVSDVTMPEPSLLLGPFQGKVACVRIAYGKGVCGTAAATDQAQLVPNVHEFPGHIACDSASRSEIVVPIHDGDAVIGVLDIDSPLEGRFTNEDCDGLEELVRALEEAGVFSR